MSATTLLPPSSYEDYLDEELAGSYGAPNWTAGASWKTCGYPCAMVHRGTAP